MDLDRWTSAGAAEFDRPTESDYDAIQWEDESRDGSTSVRGTVRLGSGQSKSDLAVKVLALRLLTKLDIASTRNVLGAIVSAAKQELEAGQLNLGDIAYVLPAANAEGSRKRFDRLVDAWREDTMLLSSLHEIVLNESYQQIIGMGPTALPLIANDLKNGPDHWGWALKAITGEDPVPAEHAGDLEAMRRDWLKLLTP